ncbi:MAG: ABC-ATPase domain-containing protein [Candidatus Nitrohelix vancouverensis]|uniref:ABC-ATPase domain-containing protein n=1 Tax=Candidatus Nitrohelix vancouverensis TaxID=2705534 RepID=A0A7T0C4Q7_9BACT|nr:MAG: ABC-ATPase domain-containing protein [Candidatus Nitrohelix vancouverensis]
MSLLVPESLKAVFRQVEGKGYKEYKVLQGKTFPFGRFELCFEHVQGDPFAQPSRLGVTVDLSALGFDAAFYDTPTRRLAMEDYLLRRMHENIALNRISTAGSGKSGVIEAQEASQAVILRSGISIRQGILNAKLFVGLPGSGRSILGLECLRLFEKAVPPILENSLMASPSHTQGISTAIAVLEDYEFLREELTRRGWSAFVADGSSLPRISGDSDLPLPDAVLFEAPAQLEARVQLPHAGSVRGMPFPNGVNLVVGGGFHGKSVLLNALQFAVYPHAPGDGRERVATIANAVKIRAEDGRAVDEIDLSGFMGTLPSVQDTRRFSSRSASGSTSQAVNILEALEAGTQLLLMDEDTCATNFMIRDERMQALIRTENEPITPFLDRALEIYETLGVSCILVMGGSGDYFEPAQEVIAMQEYRPQVVTSEAKRIVRENPGKRRREVAFAFPAVQKRTRLLGGLDFSRGKKDAVVQARRMDSLVMGSVEVNARYVEQWVEPGQLETCGWILKRLKALQLTSASSNVDGVSEILRDIGEQGLESLIPYNSGALSLPRLHEVLAVLNRLR